MEIFDQSESEKHKIPMSFYRRRAVTYLGIFLFVELILKGVFVGSIIGRQTFDEVLRRFPKFCLVSTLFFICFISFSGFVEYSLRTRSDEYRESAESFLFKVAQRAFTFWVIFHCIVIVAAAWKLS